MDKMHSMPFWGLGVVFFSSCLVCLSISSESIAGQGGKPVADFSRFVVVGDSLSAGVQNLSLNEDFQPNGYAALIARQAGVSLPLPLVARPGVPPALTLISPGPPPVLGQEPGESTGRINPFLQPMNVSVPNLKINEVLEYRPDCVLDPTIGGIRLVDVYTELVLGFPACITPEGRLMSEVEMAKSLRPTFAILWVGNNDTLWAVVNGVTSEITNPVVFQRDYEKIVQRMVNTKTDLVIGNLPDPTITPYLTSAEDLAAMLNVDLTTLGYLFGVGPGDYVTMFGLQYIQSGGTGPLPDRFVVSAEEVVVIKAANLLFNAIVYDVASRYNIPVVDIRGLMNEVHQNGIVIGEQLLTMRYLGGIFSLDGFHPTNTGYAITANEFIKTINRYYDANIPLVDVAAVKATDPLVFPSAGSLP